VVSLGVYKQTLPFREMSFSESWESSSRFSCNRVNSVRIPGKPCTSDEILTIVGKEPRSGNKRKICWPRKKFLVKNVSIDMDESFQVTAV
jgi:hypothetical protein